MSSQMNNRQSFDELIERKVLDISNKIKKKKDAIVVNDLNWVLFNLDLARQRLKFKKI